jgi:hypothetical protein
MFIFPLYAKADRKIIVGMFTSKAKADKAWRRFKYALRHSAEWCKAKKMLYVIEVNTFLNNKKV